MRWYKKLYVGDNAKNSKFKIMRKIKTRSLQVDTYLITLATNPENLLDIISTNLLLQPYYKKRYVRDKICVVGMAKGYDEALEVTRCIIDDVYNSTGGFDIKRYLGFET